jgi:hypothetical protein
MEFQDLYEEDKDEEVGSDSVGQEEILRAMHQLRNDRKLVKRSIQHRKGELDPSSFDRVHDRLFPNSPINKMGKDQHNQKP